MTAYLQECDGELNAVITNAIIFEATEVVPGVELKNRFSPRMLLGTQVQR